MKYRQLLVYTVLVTIISSFDCVIFFVEKTNVLLVSYNYNSPSSPIANVQYAVINYVLNTSGFHAKDNVLDKRIINIDLTGNQNPVRAIISCVNVCDYNVLATKTMHSRFSCRVSIVYLKLFVSQIAKENMNRCLKSVTLRNNTKYLVEKMCVACAFQRCNAINY